jgi:hypothetical protein
VAAVDDARLGGAVGVVEVAEGSRERDARVGDVDGRLHPPRPARRPLLLDRAPVLRPVLRAKDVAELLLVLCNCKKAGQGSSRDDVRARQQLRLCAVERGSPVSSCALAAASSRRRKAATRIADRRMLCGALLLICHQARCRASTLGA